MPPANQPPQTSGHRANAANEKVIASVAEAIARLRFGGIALTVHDGRVVQIEVTERQRFT